MISRSISLRDDALTGFLANYSKRGFLLIATVEKCSDTVTIAAFIYRLSLWFTSQFMPD